MSKLVALVLPLTLVIGASDARAQMQMQGTTIGGPRTLDSEGGKHRDAPPVAVSPPPGWHIQDDKDTIRLGNGTCEDINELFTWTCTTPPPPSPLSLGRPPTPEEAATARARGDLQ
jgi:hypothetical protein